MQRVQNMATDCNVPEMSGMAVVKDGERDVLWVQDAGPNFFISNIFKKVPPGIILVKWALQFTPDFHAGMPWLYRDVYFDIGVWNEDSNPLHDYFDR